MSPLDAIQAVATTDPRGGEEVSRGSTNGGVASFAPLGFSPASLLLLLNLLRNPRIRISDRLEESLNESVPKFVSRW